MKAFLASVFWHTPSLFALSLITYTFPPSSLDIQKVSGDKFVIHFLNTGVGAREAITLGCRPSLLLQHPLCPTWEEGSATSTAVANSIPLTSHFSLLPYPAPAACVPGPAVRRMMCGHQYLQCKLTAIAQRQSHKFMLQALQPGTATRGGHRAAGVITAWPGICGSNKTKSCQTLGRWEQNTLSLVIFHSFPTGDDKHGVC